jgi:DNA-binding LacI/PurR family transcriptional regulator
MKTTTTLKQVAERAGCSINAVSTVLNGARGNTVVSDALRQKIQLTADEMGYRPNLMARAMKSQRSQQIGVLVRNNSRIKDEEVNAHPLAYEFLLGISEGLEEAGYMMSLVRLSDVDPEKHTQASAFRGHLLDGLIVVNDVPAASPERLELLVPHCLWLDNNVWHEHNCLRRDEAHAGKIAMQALVDAGHNQVCLLGHPSETNEHYSFAQRTKGATEVAQSSNVRLETLTLAWEEEQIVQAVQMAKSIIRQQMAFLALDIYAAHTLMTQLMREGLCGGVHYSIACCDDGFNGGGLDWGYLSRVTFNRFEMGLESAGMMMKITDKQVKQCPSQLMRGTWEKGNTILPR